MEQRTTKVTYNGDKRYVKGYNEISLSELIERVQKKFETQATALFSTNGNDKIKLRDDEDVMCAFLAYPIPEFLLEDGDIQDDQKEGILPSTLLEIPQVEAEEEMLDVSGSSMEHLMEESQPQQVVRPALTKTLRERRVPSANWSLTFANKRQFNKMFRTLDRVKSGQKRRQKSILSPAPTLKRNKLTANSFQSKLVRVSHSPSSPLSPLSPSSHTSQTTPQSPTICTVCREDDRTGPCLHFSKSDINNALRGGNARMFGTCSGRGLVRITIIEKEHPNFPNSNSLRVRNRKYIKICKDAMNNNNVVPLFVFVQHEHWEFRGNYSIIGIELSEASTHGKKDPLYNIKLEFLDDHCPILPIYSNTVN